MSQAAKVSKAIRETGFVGASAANFFNAYEVRIDCEMGGEACAVAQFNDDSFAVYFPGRVSKEAMVLSRKADKEMARYLIASKEE